MEIAGRPARWMAALVGLAGLAVLGFLLAPGEPVAKARAVLHGLCAQRPDHTFAIGGMPLPFDARMTGIYLGALLAGGPLLLARRRGIRLGLGWLVLLAAGVVVMGMDGINSLRADLGLLTWWLPDNRLRLVTGLWAGASLGVALVWLVNLALWPAGVSLLGWIDVPIWLVGAALVGGLVLSGPGWALWPMTVLLLLGAVLTLLGLNLGLLALATSDATVAHRLPARVRLTTLALAAALAEMALLAGGRYGLEAGLGLGFGLG